MTRWRAFAVESVTLAVKSVAFRPGTVTFAGSVSLGAAKVSPWPPFQIIAGGRHAMRDWWHRQAGVGQRFSEGWLSGR